ncbi:MAG: hypothetical protein ACJAXR_001814, partial [Halopseudomonas sp.]
KLQFDDQPSRKVINRLLIAPVVSPLSDAGG